MYDGSGTAARPAEDVARNTCAKVLRFRRQNQTVHPIYGSGMDAATNRWLGTLPSPIHVRILRALLDAAEADPRWRFIEVCCSIARGAGDELSDVDAGIGIDDGAFPDALEAVAAVLTRFEGVVEVVDHAIAAWGDRPHRRFFVQFHDGVQLDLGGDPANAVVGQLRGAGRNRRARRHPRPGPAGLRRRPRSGRAP